MVRRRAPVIPESSSPQEVGGANRHIQPQRLQGESGRLTRVGCMWAKSDVTPAAPETSPDDASVLITNVGPGSRRPGCTYWDSRRRQTITEVRRGISVHLP